MTPVEVPEIPKLVDYIIERMYQSDKDQLNSLLDSVGEVRLYSVDRSYRKVVSWNNHAR